MISRLQSIYEEKIYRIYVCNSLQSIPQEKYLTISYDDLINPKDENEEDLSGDEIAFNVIQNAGLNFREEDATE